jgi:hypothetical protein
VSQPYQVPATPTDRARNREIERRLSEIMGTVVGEWVSDPMSVRCFDLRIVNEAKALVAERDKLIHGFPFESN